MRSRRARAIGCLASLLGSFWVVLPFLGLLVWGYVYMWSLVQTLIAPGQSLRLDYETKGGLGQVEVGSYVLDLSRREANLFRLRVTSPSGEQVAFLERARIRYDAPTVGVDASGLVLWVRRLPSGRFDLEAALPKPTDRPSEVPYEVLVRRAELRYEDATRSPNLPLRARARRMRVSAVGDRVVASSTIDLDGVARGMEVAARIAPDGWTVTTKFDRVQGQALIGHARRWVAPAHWAWVDPLRADQLALDGRLVASGGPDRPINLAGNARLKASNLTLSDILAQASVEGEAWIGGPYARIKATAIESRRRLRFDGSLGWRTDFAAGGLVRAEAADARAVWTPLRKALPRELTAKSPSLDGWTYWSGDRFRVAGVAKASRVAWAGETGGPTQLRLDVDERALRLDDVRSRWRGQVASGAFELRFRDGALAGWARVPRLDTRDLRAIDGVRLRGFDGGALAVLAGTARRPRAEFLIQGAARLATDDYGEFALETQGRGRWVDGVVVAERLFATGKQGAIVANGTIAPLSGRLNGGFRIGGLDLGAFGLADSGVAFARGMLDGTLRRPQANGRAEAYAIQFVGRTIPAAAALFQSAGEVVRVSALEAALGSTVARGDGRVDFGARTISGRFDAARIQLADWVPAPIEGIATVSTARVEGTFARPAVSATGSARAVVAYGVPLADVVLDARIERDRVTIPSIAAMIGPPGSRGRVEGAASYGMVDEEGEVRLNLDNVPVEALSSLWDERVDLRGRASGPIDVVVAKGKLEASDAALWLTSVSVDGEEVGDGEIVAQSDGDLWRGGAFLSKSDRLIALREVEYDAARGAISGGVEAKGVELHRLKKALAPDLDLAVDGRLATRVDVLGSIADPEVRVHQFEATSLWVAGLEAGTLTASGRRAGGRWATPELRWTSERGSLRARGSAGEDGAIGLDAEFKNVDFGWARALRPDLPEVEGAVDLELRASGTVQDPNIRATLAARVLRGADEELLDVLLDQITVQDRRIEASGGFSYQGFTGVILARAPFEALGDNPAPDQRAYALVTLPERDLVSLAPYVDWLDPKRTSGRFGGRLEVVGAEDGYQLVGRISAKGAIAAQGAETSLTDLDMEAVWADDRLCLRARAAGSAGGGLAGDLVADPPALFTRGMTLAETLDRTELSGDFTLNAFRVEQGRLLKTGALDSTVGARLQIGGTLAEPTVAGEVQTTFLDLKLPDEFAPMEQGARPMINPRFDVLVMAPNEVTMRSGASIFRMDGGGRVAGTLERPEIDARLNLASGVLRLPSARIELDRGGSIAFGYRAETGAALDLDISGRTRLSSARTGVVQRYDILIGIRGDLISPEPLSLTARSEPPDLSQDEILALLGQERLIEGIAADGVFRTRDFLTQFALPNLASPVTDALAVGLGLDYLGFEYDAFDEATVFAAKTLTRGLTIQASRQVNRTTQRARRYEIGLIYRVPSRNPFLSRLRLGAGADQDRPWKITIDYVFRP